MGSRTSAPGGGVSAESARVHPPRWTARRVAFTTWTTILVIVFGVMVFGLTSLALAWFQTLEGVAGPVTELGYGVLVGVILTVGVASQLRAAEHKIAGVQQAALAVPALLIGSALAADSQNLEAAAIVAFGVGILLALHPARAEFLRRGSGLSRPLLAIAAVGGLASIAYAIEMGRQAQDLVGPPHQVQRLATRAAMAIATVLVGLLASLRTRGWRIPAWSAGVAAVAFGVASVAYPDHPGAAGMAWGGATLAGGILFIAVAEREARRQPRP